MTKAGHTVYVQHTAGENSGFPDKEYTKAGAIMLPDIESVYAKAEMIVKVKEPIEPEYHLIKPNQVIFTYFHFASERELTNATFPYVIFFCIKSQAIILNFVLTKISVLEDTMKTVIRKS